MRAIRLLLVSLLVAGGAVVAGPASPAAATCAGLLHLSVSPALRTVPVGSAPQYSMTNDPMASSCLGSHYWWGGLVNPGATCASFTGRGTMPSGAPFTFTALGTTITFTGAMQGTGTLTPEAGDCVVTGVTRYAITGTFVF